jgi:DNA oxidative demethylase
MIGDRWEPAHPSQPWAERLGAGAVLLHGFVVADTAAVVTELQSLVEQAPFRHMVTPSGHRMSVAMTNCGAWGWVIDRTGYRYAGLDPQSGRQGYGWGSAWVRTGKMAVARIP